MQKSLLLAATALTAHAAFAQAPSSTPTPQTDLAAQVPASTTSSSSGVPSASPTMTTTATSAGGCQVPAPAAGAGYNQMTYGPDMALGANWFPVTGDNATSGVSQNADGSITIRGGDANHYNDQLNSGGVEFGGGGYFQATLSFKNPPAGWSTSADGWPAFWMSPQKDIGGGVEVDFFEFMKAGSPIFGTGMIDWGRGGLNTGTNEGGDVSIPAGFDPSQPHDYGFLWVPATGGSQGYGQAYLDGQPVGIKHTWSAGTMFDGIDRNQAQVARAVFEYARARKRMEALLVEMAQELRETSGRTQSAARSAQFVDEELVPETARHAERLRRAYETRDAGILSVLEAQRRGLQARKASVEARLEAARALAALERAAGIPWEQLLSR